MSVRQSLAILNEVVFALSELRRIMALYYFKRFRMELDLSQARFPTAPLPEEFAWQYWQPADVERHALVKYLSFHDELDSQVFPCLGDYYGCLRLMRDISHQSQFEPRATWLLTRAAPAGLMPEDVGTIQGLVVSSELGSIQNVGIIPEYRHRGFGRLLVGQALRGFAEAGCRRVTLEVTAHNTAAVALYRNLGFRIARSMYRAVEPEELLR